MTRAAWRDSGIANHSVSLGPSKGILQG